MVWYSAFHPESAGSRRRDFGTEVTPSDDLHKTTSSAVLDMGCSIRLTTEKALQYTAWMCEGREEGARYQG